MALSSSRRDVVVPQDTAEVEDMGRDGSARFSRVGMPTDACPAAKAVQ